MTSTVRVALASSLWVLSLALLVTQTVAGEDMFLAEWALYSALVACVFTGWILLERERVRAEHIAETAARTALERSGLSSVRD